MDKKDTALYTLGRKINMYAFAAARVTGIMGMNVPDEKYLKKQYYSKMGMPLNLDKPEGFSEKLQWMKLYDRNPLYTELVDKYKVKKYVADRIGEEYVIPVLGVWDKASDIDFDLLPERFVLKCNHDSGGLFICKDKAALGPKDKKRAIAKLDKHYHTNYFNVAREWAYRDVDRKIFAEEYMEDESGRELKDYKIFNFGGEPRMIQVDYNRFIKHQRSMFTIDWQPMKESFCYRTNADVKIERPQELDKMLELARELSKDLYFVRTDFYSIKDKIYFGEMTFYPEAGYGEFFPREYDKEVGSWLTLPDRKSPSLQ